MIVKVRENIFLGDKNVTEAEIKEAGITTIEIVDNLNGIYVGDCQVFGVILHSDKVNKPHVKDIACHTVKYMTQNGETVLVVDETGLTKAAYVVARAVCELENKSIYDILMELKTMIKDFDIGKAYL